MRSEQASRCLIRASSSLRASFSSNRCLYSERLSVIAVPVAALARHFLFEKCDWGILALALILRSRPTPARTVLLPFPRRHFLEGLKANESRFRKVIAHRLTEPASYSAYPTDP